MSIIKSAGNVISGVGNGIGKVGNSLLPKKQVKQEEQKNFIKESTDEYAKRLTNRRSQGH